MFSQGKTKQNHKGLRKMSRLFFSVFVIVKSSDWTRSRRKGRKDMGMEGEASLMALLHLPFLFLARKSRYQGTKGRKVQNEARKMGQKNKKTKKIPQSRKVSDRESSGVLGEGSDQVPARSQSASSEDMAMLGSVTEWVLAGQQTAICKHHEGKHQSTLDFFLYNFLLL